MFGKQYITLASEGMSQVEDRKSRFIGRAIHISGEPEAYSYIDSIRRAEKGAAHNVYAFVLGKHQEISRSSDDGEPSGTSGRPCLEALARGGLTDSLVIVTRYFGGTLLGKGGLVRAYGLAARKAIEEAGFAGIASYARIKLAISYSDWEKVFACLRGAGAKEIQPEYEAKVSVGFLVRKDRESILKGELTNLLKGKVEEVSRVELERMERLR